MSPEDDLQTQRIPAIDEMSVNGEWKPILPATNGHGGHAIRSNGHNNGPSHTSTAAAAVTATTATAATPTTATPTKYTNGKNSSAYDTTNGHDWSTATPLLKGIDQQSHHINNHHHNGNGTHQNYNQQQQQQQQHRANNNEWTSALPGAIKNGWKELPQDDHADYSNGNRLLNGKNDLHITVTSGSGGTTIGGDTINGSGGGGGGVGGDKLLFSAEQDPLTGHGHGGNRRQPDLDEISSCGIGSCQPKWAKMFASTHVFMVFFLLAWVLQGMYYTYFVSVITTIEKLFQIKSKTTGLLMSATEVGQIMTALFLTYYAGRGHRPRWIACGMVLFAISAFGCTLPHFIYGNQLMHANNAFYGSGTGTISSASTLAAALSNGTNGTNRSDANLCRIPDLLHGNLSSGNVGECKEEILKEQTVHTQITNIVLTIFFISLLGVGIGQTAVCTLGIPYIDDNVASRESPIYIAITIGVRILGPASGFILGSFCTRLYVDLSDPNFGPTDPRWVGAWYLGLVIIASLMIITSLAMFTFPKHLKGNRIPPPMKMRAIEAQKKLEKKQQEEELKPQLKDFPKAIKRQLSNDILMFRTASSVLHLLPVAGLYTFLPKYMESQFRLTAHESNLISGIFGILVMGVGIVISGVVILKCSPTARTVAAWIAFTAVVYSAGMAILMFVGCPMDNFVGLDTIKGNSLPALSPNCNMTCDCDMRKFSPICGTDGQTYFSSCHAGCTSLSMDEHGKLKYTDCGCIPSSPLIPAMPDSMNVTIGATSGYCDSNCQNLVFFMLLFSFLVFMHSTSEVGSVLLIMRCTDPKDKTMAMGIIQFAIGLFGNVPCPIIYGAVIDSTCLIWETICGKQGACSLYDVDAFRHFFLGTTSGIMFLAFIIDLIVWHKAHRIDIDPESNASETELEKPIATAAITQEPHQSPPESSV